VFLDPAAGVAAGDIVPAVIDEASEYDLYGTVAKPGATARRKAGRTTRSAPKRRRAQ
jgi:hypothetical protein